MDEYVQAAMQVLERDMLPFMPIAMVEKMMDAARNPKPMARADVVPGPSAFGMAAVLSDDNQPASMGLLAQALYEPGMPSGKLLAKVADFYARCPRARDFARLFGHSDARLFLLNAAAVCAAFILQMDAGAFCGSDDQQDDGANG